MNSNSSAAPTFVLLAGLFLTAIVLPSQSAAAIFTTGAIGTGISLCVATLLEAKDGIRYLIRVDLLMIWVLYFLTFLEFLFPQPGVDDVVVPSAAISGTYAVLLAFAGLVVGRGLISKKRTVQNQIVIKPSHIFSGFLFAAILGYLHILLAVGFDVPEALRQMALPRFEQSWTRGKYGSLYSLLYELGALISLIPPIAGLIYARSKEYKLYQKSIVALVFAVTWYQGISGGTRSVVAVYAFGFMGAYFLMKPQIKIRQLLAMGVPMAVFLFITTSFMLEFRTVGLSNYSFSTKTLDTFYVDLNIVNLAHLTQLFPNNYNYLGFEIPYTALIRPIPRVLWPSKPEGLSTGIEEALGVSGITLSTTFVGEAYMAGGFLGVLLFSLLFGAAAEMWNRVGRDSNSSFSQLLYASGFLCAALAMRSLLSMVPLMLPSFALWLYGRIYLSKAPRTS